MVWLKNKAIKIGEIQSTYSSKTKGKKGIKGGGTYFDLIRFNLLIFRF